MHARCFRWIAIGTMVFAITGSVFATEYTRSTDAAAAGSWVDSAKWTPSGSPTTISDQAILNVGVTQRSITFDQDIVLSTLGIGYDLSSASTINSNVTFSATSAQSLSAGDTGTAGTIWIGGGGTAATGTKTGTLNLGANMALNLQGAAGSAFYIGGQAGNGPVSVGTMTMDTGSALNIGTSSVRATWVLGHHGSLTAATSSGTFSATGGSLTAYLSNLVVGENIRGSNNSNHKAEGSLNLTGLTSASVDTTSLSIGVSTESNAKGTVTIGSGQTLAVSDSAPGTINIGTRAAGASLNTQTNVAEGTLSLNSGAAASFGTGTNRAALNVGINAGNRGSTVSSLGTITAAATSTFSAHLSTLVIGTQNATIATSTDFLASGSIDLRSATVSAFDVSGDVTIGNGAGQGSQGELRLPGLNAVIGGNLTVGDSETGGGSQASSSGLLDLVGTHVEVSGDVAFNATGSAEVLVDGVSAGLRLDSDSTFTLTMTGTSAADPNSAYHITFEDPDAIGLYYGFAWEGNHLATVQGLVDDFHITWTDNMTGNAAGVFYDSDLDLTYIGVIPEPTSALLLLSAMGGLALIRRRRR